MCAGGGGGVGASGEDVYVGGVCVCVCVRGGKRGGMRMDGIGWSGVDDGTDLGTGGADGWGHP